MDINWAAWAIVTYVIGCTIGFAILGHNMWPIIQRYGFKQFGWMEYALAPAIVLLWPVTLVLIGLGFVFFRVLQFAFTLH